MTSIDPHTPVLVGVGAITQREEDPSVALEPFELMVAALQRAAEDAGTAQLLAEASSIRVPQGFWKYSDPGRLVADRVGAAKATTILAELGVLQQTILKDACEAIAAGRETIALIVGGEAKYRSLRAKILDTEAAELIQEGVAPDQHLLPKEDIFHALELERGLVMPLRAFAVIENARRFAAGTGLDEHRDELARFWADFSLVASGHPGAWRSQAVTAAEIRDPGAGNRMISFPYTKLHSSEWNVDQAAALILCSVGKAQELGIDESKWVFPLAGTESNHVVVMSEREEMHRSAGAEIAGEKVFELAGLRPSDVGHFDLYSCFPAAARLYAEALRLPADQRVTVTGGMAFGGGPLNNYVLQSTAAMADKLRADAGSVGLVTAVSGVFNKQGYMLWSTKPAAGGFVSADVSEQVAAVTGRRELVRDYEGLATVASFTVGFSEGRACDAVVVADLPDGRRTIATTDDGALAVSMTEAEFCGTRVTVAADGTFSRASAAGA